ncbi:MAG: peptidase C1 [Nitrospira bacterium HGW-Nitrospira-1]|nr:MAG: peptidase C1 [Nitrospira bacterium HGW-Nitrospira-1]
MKDQPKRVTKSGKQLTVIPDTLDFRDKMYEATLVEVPIKIDLDKKYKELKVPVLDQGKEGACTGYGLATVIHYLMRTRKVAPDKTEVSPKMLYLLAKRYDEWPGEEYEGSSPRGVMKGWHKHGAASRKIWDKTGRITPSVAADAANRPLGAYYRVNHKDLVAMHSAIAEVGVLYAGATVHAGWDNVKDDGIIAKEDEILGGHAFAVVAYDKNGFWIQNSWGTGWGKNGFARISYDDWLANGTDVWVARLGAPVIATSKETVSIRHSALTSYSDAQSNYELRRHIISLGNNGVLNPSGAYGTSKEEVDHIFSDYIPAVAKKWKKKRILLYAHGGLVDEASAVQRLADYLPALVQAEVYPISFIWHSDYWSTLTFMLQDAIRRRRPEGALDAAKDFMLDRLDDVLEPVARTFTGKAQWDEMKENAMSATTGPDGGARYAAECLAGFLDNNREFEVHVAGHSAGSIFHAPLVQLLSSKNIKINTCTLWAPACTMKLFREAYMPAIQNGTINKLAIYTLKDDIEKDDNCGGIYHKSLLYLVSNAFEDKAHIPLFSDGEPILGMAKFLAKEIGAIQKGNCQVEWIKSPDAATAGALHHGDFDDDKLTVTSTLNRICGDRKVRDGITFKFKRSASSLRDRRLKLE